MKLKFSFREFRLPLYLGALTLALATVLQVAHLEARQAVGPQRTFASPEEGVAAFIDAMRKNDLNAMETLLGPGSRPLIESGDPVQDKLAIERVLAAYDMKSSLVSINAIARSLHVGDDDWALPIPLVRDDGAWRFDIAAGGEEIIARRIGRNESNAIQASLAFVDAQREYGSVDRDGDGIFEYAQRFVSTPGMRDGLYWPTQVNEPLSPLGELFAAANAAGVQPQASNVARRAAGDTSIPATPYYGYYFKILTSQGSASMPGGAYDYIVNGSMLGGVAVIAYPAAYGVSGVMTFTVNHDGIVYQTDLGPETVLEALDIVDFNPDDTWERVPVE